MPIQRLPDPPRAVPLLTGHQALYEVDLSAEPSPAWRAAFLRPPARLITATGTPDLGRVGLVGGSVHFRTTPARLHSWLRWIDRWIIYANSVVEE
jgi:hypothetical protein